MESKFTHKPKNAIYKNKEWLEKYYCNRKLDANRISILTKSTKDFLNYIGDCPVSCYQYKWNL